MIRATFHPVYLSIRSTLGIYTMDMVLAFGHAAKHVAVVLGSLFSVIYTRHAARVATVLATPMLHDHTARQQHSSLRCACACSMMAGGWGPWSN